MKRTFRASHALSAPLLLLGAACGDGTDTAGAGTSTTSTASGVDCTTLPGKDQHKGAPCCVGWQGAACTVGLTCQGADPVGVGTCTPPAGTCGVAEDTYVFTYGPDAANTCNDTPTITTSGTISCNGSQIHACTKDGGC